MEIETSPARAGLPGLKAAALTKTAKKHTGETRRVLVVDDDASVRCLLFEALRKWGYQPLSAEDGARAQELIRRYRPGVVLLDLRMPLVDGWAVLDWLQTVDYHPRVIVVTGDDDADTDELLSRGAAEVVRKGESLAALFSAVRHAISRSDEGLAGS